ncbi:MAG: isocitrate/isopropylmalate dehydrogenase family protein [Gemmatimonadales bacterium]
MSLPLTLIRGDGIGPEIVEASLQVLYEDELQLRVALENAGADFDIDEQIAGVAALEQAGTPLPDETVASIERTRLVLKGPLTTPVGLGFRSINVALRRKFDLYANVRPAVSMVPGGKFADVDIVLVRENTEGLYAGYENLIGVGGDPRAVAQSMAVVTRYGCERIIRYAFEYALANGRAKVTIVHKANILKAVSGLFLDVGYEIAEEYKGRVGVEDVIIDACAMKLVMDPEAFDVIVTTNMFGDILSDEIAGLVGGLGMAPGANIGTDCALFEAVHGSAPDIAGQGVANPSAMILAACMLLEHVGEQPTAKRIREALIHAVEDGSVTTPDLGGNASTIDFAEVVSRRLG